MNFIKIGRIPAFLVIILTLASCGGDKKGHTEKPAEVKTVNVPQFNIDSAYQFVQKQVDFGPRVPNTVPHENAGDYLVKKFEQYGATVQTQEFESTTFDNQKLNLKNIIASFDPEKKKRILLASHWDSRPFADKDPEHPNDPIDGANDGASGVGVLLEIARGLSANENPEVGVDIILFDGEDWGELESSGRIQPPEGLDSWWCLGSQYWSKNKHVHNYSAYYGILLDMVGGKNGKFYIEEYSKYFAPSIVDKVWNRGIELGFSNYFVKRPGGQTTDDHYFVNKYAKIPMIDIISYDPVDGGFGDFHHTHRDNMGIISKETLGAVGKTLLYVIYYE